MFSRFMFLAMLFLAAVGVNASAHATTHFVASTGADSASCSRTAPCASLSTALSNALPNDTIVCVDAVAAFAITIDKSIDIDCSAGRAIFRDTNVNAASIYINIPVSSNDPFRIVRLRGISILGADATTKNVAVGIVIFAAASVSIEDAVVSDVAGRGIQDSRTGGQTKLFVTDTIVRNSGGSGIVANSAAVNIVVLDNVRSENNAYGIAVGRGNNVVINRSVFSGNSTAGVEGDPGSQVVISNSTISHNNIGVQSTLSVRISGNDIAFNNTAFSGSAATMGLNRYSGNVSMGTTPGLVPNAPADIGP